MDLVFSGPPLSLRASKLLHLMVDASGVDACEPVRHEVQIARLNEVFRLSVSEFVEAARELVGCVVELRRMTKKGRRTYKAGSLVSYVAHDRDDGSVDLSADPAMLRWEFSPVTREVLADSNYWAALSRRALLALEGRYSLRLYETIALRKGLNLKEEHLTIDQLRDRLGVPIGKLKTWSDLRVSALEPAIREVRQLSGLGVSYEPVTRGKAKVVGIILRWDQASPESRAAAARELETSRVGRKARRENMVEQIVDIAPAIEKIRFPRDGDIRGTPFEVIARASLPSPARDYGMVGLDFYKWAIKENVPTVGDKVTEIFAGFCARQKPES